MKILSTLNDFFFRPIGSRGFSAMRIAWAFFTGSFLLMQWKDVTYYYSQAGIMPHSLESIYIRTSDRFTILDWVDQPAAVFALYLILLVTLFCMMIGLWPRVMTIASVLLLFSFHERNTMILGGGDTLLRNIGFLLMIAPGIDGFSVQRLKKRWTYWKKKQSFISTPVMPIWPWRLLVWQMVVLYGTSLWYKLLGTMWIHGTAVEATFHHPVYARFSPAVTNWLLPLMGTADYLALIWQGTWLLLLIPERFIHIPLRRILIIGGILFHGGILLLMDAGVFSLAIFTAYLGLLRDDDINWLKNLLTTHYLPLTPITLLYDGHCGLCLRSIFVLRLFDWLHVLQYIDFRNEQERMKVAPDLKLEDLDRSMHILIPKKFSILTSQFSILTGFDAFRHITRYLPPLMILHPLLWIPGVAPIGRRIYASIAESRKRCDHEHCSL